MRRFLTLFVLLPIAIVVVALSVANRGSITVSLDPVGAAAPGWSASGPLYVFLFAAVAGHSTFAAGLARLFTRPLVRGALLVRRFSALARDLALLVPLHRRKSPILCCHRNLLTGRYARGPGLRVALRCIRRSALKHLGCNRCAITAALTI